MSAETPAIEGGPDQGSKKGEDARGRLRHALLAPSRGQALVAVLLAVLAFAAVTQVRVLRSTDAYAGMRQGDLVQALNGLAAAQTRAQTEITTLQRTRAALQSSSDQRAAAIKQARTEVATLGILAGTLPADGTGVQVKVTASSAGLSVNYLLDGIEELRDAGAEAISINGVRVVAQTAFTNGAGESIVVGGKQLSSPYLVSAIGEPTTLVKAVNFPGGFRDDMSIDHATLTVQRIQRVQIGAIVHPGTPQYAQSAPGG